MLDSGAERFGFKSQDRACGTVYRLLEATIVATMSAMLSGNSLRKTAHTHRASAHQVAKLVAALLRVARVIAGLAESNGSLRPGL